MAQPQETGSGPKLHYSRVRRQAELQEATDRELLKAMCQGEEAALEVLIERKTRPLVQTAYRIVGNLEEAQDIVQMTFFRVWEHRERFDGRFSPNTWIYRITSNLAIDHLRSRQSKDRSREPVRLHLREVAHGNARREGDRLQQSEVLGIFQELAAELSEKQRVVFLLREVEGRSSQEVAEIVGCRESTVRNHLFNARKHLRRQVRERYPEYLRASLGRRSS